MTFCYDLDGIANIQTKKYPQHSDIEGMRFIYNRYDITCKKIDKIKNLWYINL